MISGNQILYYALQECVEKDPVVRDPGSGNCTDNQPSNHRLWICHGANCLNGYISGQLIHRLSWGPARQNPWFSHLARPPRGGGPADCLGESPWMDAVTFPSTSHWLQRLIGIIGCLVGQYLMEVELDFNELSLPWTGVVYVVVWLKSRSKRMWKMVLKLQGDRLFF